ncbi:MAG: hypothetical protein Q9192_006902 [Flavoplaca navasiana]
MKPGLTHGACLEYIITTERAFLIDFSNVPLAKTISIVSSDQIRPKKQQHTVVTPKKHLPMSPSRFAIQLTYLEDLAKLHQYYTAQRGEGNAPEELTSLLRTEIQTLAMMRRPPRPGPTLAKTLQLIALTTALGCKHDSTAAENLCVFAELHRLILQRIVNTKNLELVRVDEDEKAKKQELKEVDEDGKKISRKASKKGKTCKSRRNGPYDYEEKDEGSDNEVSDSGSEGE